MRIFATATLALFCGAGFAQTPPTPGAASVVPGPIATPLAGTAFTESAHVRAFNAGPDGRIRSLYLSNGHVVDLSSEFGPALGGQIRRGTRVRVMGTRQEINGESIVAAQQLIVAGQTFTAQPGMAGPGAGPGAPAGSGQAGRMLPPPPGGPGQPPPPPAGAGMPAPPPPPPCAGPGAPPPPAGGPGAPPPPAGPAGARNAPPPPPPAPNGQGPAGAAPGNPPAPPVNGAKPPADAAQPAPAAPNR